MMNTFVVYVENKPGVLTRVASLFRRRAFNIDSLTVGRTEKPEVSRMTITAEADQDQARRIEANLYKLVNVLLVENITHEPSIVRDLAMIKVAATHEADEVPRRLSQALVQHALHPRATGIHDGLRLYFLAVGEPRQPTGSGALRRLALGGRDHARAPQLGVERIRDHQASVVDAAIGIDEAAFEFRLQRGRKGGRVEANGR